VTSFRNYVGELWFSASLGGCPSFGCDWQR